MNKRNIISAAGANQLYWLGRYEERVYTTLHLLRKCYDKMIDGEPNEYVSFWQKFNVANTYLSNEDFELGMLYDENNPNSVLSAQTKAMDNAMVLRNCIMSESLAYLEMSMAKLRQCKSGKCLNLTQLQQVTDWSLAFFGSVEQRIENHLAMDFIYMGRNVEYIDTLLRFGYPLQRIKYAFENLQRYLRKGNDVVDYNVENQIIEVLATEELDKNDTNNLLMLINSLIRV